MTTFKEVESVENRAFQNLLILIASVHTVHLIIYLCFEHPYKEETYKPVCPPPSTLTRKKGECVFLHSLSPFPLQGLREVDATQLVFLE